MLAIFVIEFTVFSFVGWLWESVLYTVLSGKLDNRGFLYGPLCPIYGFGAIIAARVFGGFVGRPVFLFFICMVSSAILEYLTSFILEKFFGARWWDYSTIPFNVHGRICLSCSMAFGFAGVILLPYGILPIISFIESLPMNILVNVAIVLAGFIGGDVFLSIGNMVDLNRFIDDIEKEAKKRRDAAGKFVDEHGGNYLREEVLSRVPKLRYKELFFIRNIVGFMSGNRDRIIRLLKISVGFPLDEKADKSSDDEIKE
ncbi:putative ABC transporter permease [Butyrivibrio sp. MC2013]|uniref:putative ABC transporter permease n=1 Tax=Butyrivibrio sp. MC2013 TaxID=1280686 RepID=UPI0003FF33FC|nr:putative ABC transporter permease [Butyrivibrio sp. MC2013]